MKKETPIQKLKGHIHDRLIAAEELDEPTLFLEGLMLIADQFLEEEREVIENAYRSGCSECGIGEPPEYTAEQYYDDHFNTTDK